ncbi:hypothetical protein Tco_1032612 [Tanacetum coccineum]|uniref:Uncharacterized protein n=1 Tax=Tanacetum coccineum TaxID=301880 RepID=A0ABQ5GCS4_9ASTR
MMTKVTTEVNLEQFKNEQAAVNSRQRINGPLLQATIEKTRFEADREFAEIMMLSKARQLTTTQPATIPRFEKNKVAMGNEDISTCIGSPESVNNRVNRITIGAGDQSSVPEKDVPSHGLRKQQLGGLIFGAEVKIPVGFDLRTFEGLHCGLSRGQERRTWNLMEHLLIIKKQLLKWAR